MRATAANFYISRFYHLALKNRLDANALLHEAGILPDIIDVPHRRIDAEKLAAFIIALCDRLQDESMSLSSSPVPRGCFYMMGKLTIQEPDLNKALCQMLRFLGMTTKSFSPKLATRGDKAMLSFDLLDPDMDADHLFAELNLLMLHRYSSWLIGENIPLIEIDFSYPPPVQVKEYAFLFPGNHNFNARTMGFTFSRHFLQYRNAQNAGTMKSFMRRCPMQLFSQPKTDFSLGSEVHALLYRQQQVNFLSLDEVAEALLLAPRTLIRRLKEEGASFQQIKDQVRRDRAIYYLTGSTATISEIAIKTGFSDPSVFARAFKSWTGFSPREFRENYRKMEKPVAHATLE